MNALSKSLERVLNLNVFIDWIAQVCTVYWTLYCLLYYVLTISSSSHRLCSCTGAGWRIQRALTPPECLLAWLKPPPPPPHPAAEALSHPCFHYPLRLHFTVHFNSRWQRHELFLGFDTTLTIIRRKKNAAVQWTTRCNTELHAKCLTDIFHSNIFILTHCLISWQLTVLTSSWLLLAQTAALTPRLLTPFNTSKRESLSWIGPGHDSIITWSKL